MPYSKCINPLVEELVQYLSPEVREDFEERAGIMEFDGRTSRELAEALALLDVLKRRPAALLDVDVFSVTQDRVTKFLVCRRGRLTTERLRSVGYEGVKAGQSHRLCIVQINNSLTFMTLRDPC